jgi:hypothetical protein
LCVRAGYVKMMMMIMMIHAPTHSLFILFFSFDFTRACDVIDFD